MCSSPDKSLLFAITVLIEIDRTKHVKKERKREGKRVATRHTKLRNEQQNATTKRINCVKTLLVCMNESYMHTNSHVGHHFRASLSVSMSGGYVTLRGNIKFAPHTRNTKQIMTKFARCVTLCVWVFFSLGPLCSSIRCIYRHA